MPLLPLVAKGVFRIGYGRTEDRTKATSYPAGSYLIVPAGAWHYDGPAEETVIIGTAIGPWTTTYADGNSRLASP